MRRKMKTALADQAELPPIPAELLQKLIPGPVTAGQSGARRRRAQTHLKQLGLIGAQTDLDVAQGLAPRELGERHHTKQLCAIERASTSMGLSEILCVRRFSELAIE